MTDTSPDDIQTGTRLGARLLVALGVVGAIGLAVFFYAGNGGSGGGARSREVPVEVAQVRKAEFADVLEAIGTAQAKESVTVTAKTTEIVRKIHFQDGARVKMDDILAELTAGIEAAELDEAYAELEGAEKELRLGQSLVDRGTAAKATLVALRADRDAAAARVNALKARLADKLILAPFDGVLGLRLISPGTLVQPGDKITTLADISLIKADFSIPETFLSALKVGQKIEAKSAAYQGRHFEGVVAAIDTRVDPVTRSVMVRAEIPNEDGSLLPGMLLTIDLRSNIHTSLAVPEQSIVPIVDRKYVYVVSPDEIPELREVIIGRRRPGVVEITEGVSEGDYVVTLGTHRIRDDQPVKVQNEDFPRQQAPDNSSNEAGAS